MQRLHSASEKVGVTTHKLIAYVEKQDCAVYEYTCYLKDLESLNYDLKDKSYSMPKNFSKEYGRIEAEKVGKKYEGLVEVDYCYQDLNDLPSPYKFPEGRTKPWGTVLIPANSAKCIVKSSISGKWAYCSV